jgi:hypothetical protein
LAERILATQIFFPLTPPMPASAITFEPNLEPREGKVEPRCFPERTQAHDELTLRKWKCAPFHAPQQSPHQGLKCRLTQAASQPIL